MNFFFGFWSCFHYGIISVGVSGSNLLQGVGSIVSTCTEEVQSELGRYRDSRDTDKDCLHMMFEAGLVQVHRLIVFGDALSVFWVETC